MCRWLLSFWRIFGDNDRVKRYNSNAGRGRGSVLLYIPIHQRLPSPTGGTTNTAEAIFTMRNAMFTAGAGDRPGVRNVGIVMTDGESNERDDTFDQASSARAQGINLISVAINMRVSSVRTHTRVHTRV